ncbi:hypothetical protein ACQPXB_23095 [Amycolatopsis sp. CA-161197]|uniref:hypothetical protein n=1 Tax=unclassified Amycolatopsis TaxID=2618356 RepID=UPI0034565127
MTVHHHASNRYCTRCGRWHSHCDACGWFWYGACTFSEALRRIRLHQLDEVYADGVTGRGRTG